MNAPIGEHVRESCVQGVNEAGWPSRAVTPRSGERLGLAIVLLVLACAAPVAGQDANGEAVFRASCASCHAAPDAASRAPGREALRRFTPESIVEALTTGLMQPQGRELTEAQRLAVAAFLAGRPAVPVASSANACTASAPLTDPAAGAFWNGWGVDPHNTRFQPADRAGLTAAQVPRLTLKWAFGFPNARSGRSQPTVAGGRLFVAGEGGDVYALDPRTGCTHWTFRAQATVRTAITIGPSAGTGASGPYAAYFGDGRANVYALDAATGRPLWTRRIDDHPSAAVTGAPVLHEGRLYVPVAGLGEEVTAANLNYSCCTFRGSVSALDAATGAPVWKTYTIAEPAQPRGRNSLGTALFGPSGGGVWSAPTIDAARGVLYVGTGNGYSDPPQPYTNAVLALELATGRLAWSYQATAGDVWILGCPSAKDANCPAQPGPDHDFGSSPILATLPGGRQIIVAGQKSGVAHALDPDRQGALVWRYRAGQGGLGGGIQWGSAVDDRYAYVAVSDASRGPAAAGGLHAVRLDTGERAWYTPPPTLLCGTLSPSCHGAQSGAVTAIPGVVFSGSNDGGLRAFAADTGAVIWQFDSNREYETVNGVRAVGGSIDGPGPVVVGGMVYVNSGYAFGRPGNVLLAFGLE